MHCYQVSRRHGACRQKGRGPRESASALGPWPLALGSIRGRAGCARRCPCSRCPCSRCPCSRCPCSRCPCSRCPCSRCPCSRCPCSRCPRSRCPCSRCPCSSLQRPISRSKSIRSCTSDTKRSGCVIAKVPVVTLAPLVVVPQHAFTLVNQRQAVFERVVASGERMRQPPDPDFLEQAVRQPLAIPQQAFGLHAARALRLPVSGRPAQCSTDSSVSAVRMRSDQSSSRSASALSTRSRMSGVGGPNLRSISRSRTAASPCWRPCSRPCSI
jgi:hypothetical protein